MVCVQLLSHIQHSATPWTVARQAPMSMGLSRQEYWSGLQLPNPMCVCGRVNRVSLCKRDDGESHLIRPMPIFKKLGIYSK